MVRPEARGASVRDTVVRPEARGASVRDTGELWSQQEPEHARGRRASGRDGRRRRTHRRSRRWSRRTRTPDKFGNTVMKQLDVLSVIVPQTWGRCGIVQHASSTRDITVTRSDARSSDRTLCDRVNRTSRGPARTGSSTALSHCTQTCCLLLFRSFVNM